MEVSIVKKKILIMGLVCILCGCTHQKKLETTEKSFELKTNRIQVAQNEKIDYLSYIKNCEEELQYNHIDTSKIGTYQIHYRFISNQKITQTLTVDVVKMFDSGIYSPLGIKPNIVKNPEDITVLVNKINRIPQDWKPDDLVKVVDSQQKLRREAADAYKLFYQEARKRGIQIHSISGYRTNEQQKLYWDNQVKYRGEEYASQYSAYPTCSEHQLGLAIDVSYKTTGDRLNEDVAKSEIGRFIVSDAYKYGFILRYPKDKVRITNYGYEPWHMRYVGKDLAKKLHDENITLEEYYGVNL